MRHLALIPILMAGLGGAAEPLAQPTPPPGTINATPQPLPPLAGITARPAAERPVYGLYVWGEEYRRLRTAIRQVGWRQFRFGGPWSDDVMRLAVEDDAEVLYTLSGGKGRQRSDFASDEAFLADYQAQLATFLGRYGPGGSFFTENPALPERPIRHIEVWNEPNFQYLIPDREPRAAVEREREALYARLLPAAHAAIKARWPTVQVVGFSGGGASAGDLRWFELLWRIDGPRLARSCDIASTHPYVDPAPPEGDAVRSWGSYSVAKSLAAIRRTIGAAMPMWYTEVGWPIAKADGGFFPTRNDQAMVGPLLQAAYACRMYALSLRLGVERTHIMFATDTDGFNAGFFLRDGAWRPSAHAVQTMIRAMPFPKLAAAPHDGDDGWYAWTFADARPAEAARPPVTMAFALAGPRQVTIPWDAPAAEATGMLGAVARVVAVDGRLTVDIGPCPVYLTPAR